MANKPLIYLIYDDLQKAVTGIAKKVFLGRPENTASEMTSFIVVELPVTLYGRVAGDFSVMTDTYGTYTVYSKAKSDSTLNVGSHSTLVENVMKVFPVKGENITASKPRILMEGYDNNGFQATKVTFRLRTKFNINKQ